MNIFLLRYFKSKQYFLNERLLFSQFKVVFLWRKSKLNFLLASMKSLTNYEIPSSNLLQRACSGFLIAACVSNSCSVFRLWSWQWFRKPAMNVHWKNRSIKAKESRTEICSTIHQSKFRLHCIFVYLPPLSGLGRFSFFSCTVVYSVFDTQII